MLQNIDSGFSSVELIAILAVRAYAPKDGHSGVSE